MSSITWTSTALTSTGRLPSRLETGVGSCEREQVVHQLGHVLCVIRDVGERLAVFVRCTRMPERELGGRADECHRRPQFVRGIGRESHDVLHGIVEAAEHGVECHGQSASSSFAGGTGTRRSRLCSVIACTARVI